MGAATKAYLVAYNAAQTWGWLACLLLLARSIAQGKSPEAIYHDVAPVLGEQLADMSGYRGATNFGCWKEQAAQNGSSWQCMG